MGKKINITISGKSNLKLCMENALYLIGIIEDQEVYQLEEWQVQAMPFISYRLFCSIRSNKSPDASYWEDWVMLELLGKEAIEEFNELDGIRQELEWIDSQIG